MSRIAIKDLTESVELDHEAMTAISGGARFARRQALPSQSAQRVVTRFPWEIGLAVPRERHGKPDASSK